MALSDETTPVPRPRGDVGRSTEENLLRQIREYNRVFRDVPTPTHQILSVAYDNEISSDGDLTRNIGILLMIGDTAQHPTYVWRIPHPPNKPPFAVSVSTRPIPLAFDVKAALPA